MNSSVSWRAWLAVLAMCAIVPSIQAATLRSSAQMVAGFNGSVPFDRVYRVSAHNTFNPNTYRSLEEALDRGVRSIEIDVYGSFAGWSGNPVDKDSCEEVGGTWNVIFGGGGSPGNCSGFDRNQPRKAMVDSQTDAIAGRAIAARPGQRFLRLRVAHDPTSEDGWTDWLVDSVRWIPVVGTLIDSFLLDAEDEYFGNNCATGTAQGVGNMQTELAKCLQHVKTWMDSHPGHTPVMLYFDIKKDMDRLTALGFDATVRGVFGGKLYKPADLRSGFPSMRARVAQAGWPQFDTLRGMALGLYTGGETFQVFGDEQPNDTLRYYLDGLRELGFQSSATFVCPRISVASEVDAPYSFGKGPKATPASIERLMGQVVCNNIYTGKHAFWQQTNSRTFEGALGAVDAARSRNLLTYVWSYADKLAVSPEVALEFIRHGVNLFDDEPFKLSPAAALALKQKNYGPIYSFGNNILPLEGLAGITNYGFVIRVKNSPYVLTSDGSNPVLRAYNGGANQQWAMTSAGQLYALSNAASCISLTPLVRYIHDDYASSSYPIRPESLYLNVTGDGYFVPNGSAVTMAACNRRDVPGFFSLTKSYQPSLDAPGDADANANDGGVMLALNRNKYNVKRAPLYLTTTQYDGNASLIAKEFTDEHMTIAAMGVRGERNTVWDFRTVRAGPVALESPAQTVFTQTFELYFDKSAAVVVDAGLATAPALGLISGANEPRGAVARPRHWRDYLPATDANVNLGSADPALPDEDRAVLVAARVLDQAKLANGTLEYTAIARSSPTWRVAKKNHLGQNTGDMPLQAVASEVLSAAEYRKWLSAVDTSMDDIPRLDRLGVIALNVLGELPGVGDWNRKTNVGCVSRFCTWWRRPLVTSHPAAFKYWEVKNKPAAWVFAEQMLTAEEFEKWNARARMRVSDLALDGTSQMLEMSVLLEDGHTSVVGTQPNPEQGNWRAEQASCYDINEDDPTNNFPNYERCPNRFLAAIPGHDAFYHWYDIPFDADHFPMAEFAFNNPRPLWGGPLFPADWTRWQAAYALRTSVSGRPLSYRDVPISDLNRDLVAFSNLLSPSDKAQWLEKDYLESQFVALQRPITHRDIDPDGIKAGVAREYLDDAEFALWQEREAVSVDDFPLSTPLYQSVGGQLLSATELGKLGEKLAVPNHGEFVGPLAWYDIPPVLGKRIAAETLLSPSEYALWLEARDATELDFPAHFATAAVDSRARQTLSRDEYSNWRVPFGVSETSEANLPLWFYFPRRSGARAIAHSLLPPSESAVWEEMLGQIVLPQHLGATMAMEPCARFGLSDTDYATWSAQATGFTLEWQAFRFDRSRVQQRIVESVFGIESSQAAAWRAWAGVE